MPSRIRQYSLALWSAASAAVRAGAFVPAAHPSLAPPSRARRGRPPPSLRSDRIPGDGDGSDDDHNSEEDDDSLLDELRSAKQEKFGADLPTTDELAGAARNAENAFLAAMLEQTRQFRRIKSDEGAERAVEAFMERMQEEDEAARKQGEGNGDDVGEGGDADAVEREWFAQRMQDELKEGEDEDNGNEWQ